MIELSAEAATRPHWQRSEAMVLFSELTFDSFGAVLEDFDYNGSNKDKGSSDDRVPHWQQSSSPALSLAGDVVDDFLFKASRHVTDFIASADGDLIQPCSQAVAEYTFFGRLNSAELITATTAEQAKTSVTRQCLEGFKATVSFPLNLVNELTDTGLISVTNLEELADVYRSPWFIAMCENAATTGNGYWSDASIGYFTRLGYRVPSETRGPLKEVMGEIKLRTLDEAPGEYGSPYEAKDDGSIEFAGWVKGALNKYLYMVNHNTPRNASSGCPVRHSQPYFDETDYDQASIERMAKLFNKPPDELVAGRHTNAIRFGLESLATAFETSSAQ